MLLTPPPPSGLSVGSYVDMATLSGLPAGPLVPQFPHLSGEQKRIISSWPAQISAWRSVRAPVARADPF